MQTPYFQIAYTRPVQNTLEYLYRLEEEPSFYAYRKTIAQELCKQSDSTASLLRQCIIC